MSPNFNHSYNSNSHPLVSIVIPVFNTELYLIECIESVIKQTFEDWELILINDFSTDNSQNIIDAYADKDSRIISIKNESNLGSGPTRNKGIESARGRFLCFLDSDDIWQPNKLELQLQFMESNNYPFVFSSYDFIGSEGNKIKSPKIVTTQPVDYHFLLKRTEIFTSTVMIDLNQIGRFLMPHHRRKQDYGLWLSILKSGQIAYGMQEILASYRQREGSATSKKWTLIWKHVVFLRETQKFGWFESFYYTFHWGYNGFIKYYLK